MSFGLNRLSARMFVDLGVKDSIRRKGHVAKFEFDKPRIVPRFALFGAAVLRALTKICRGTITFLRKLFHSRKITHCPRIRATRSCPLPCLMAICHYTVIIREKTAQVH